MKSSRNAVPPSPPDAGASPGWFRRHPAWTGLIVLLAALLSLLALLLTNLQWLRGPLQRAVSAQLRREFSIGAMQLRWAGQPVLELHDVVLGNLRGGSEPRMVRLESVQLRLSWLDLLHGQVFVSRIAVSDADVLLERLRNGRRNWAFGGAPQAAPRPLPSWLRLGGVSLAYGRVRYLDHQTPMAVTVHVRPLDTQAGARAGRHATRFDFSGQYRGNTFSGHALSGSVLSLQDTGQPFPLQGELTAGETRVQLEGVIADAMQLSGVDMRLQIKGPTLANLYPFLLLPLPASPPYVLQGRLRRDGGHFALDDLGGRIGSTDLRGQGSYVLREPRPLLMVQLHSDLMDITDLGPLIDLETKSRTGRPDTQAAGASRERASRSDQQMRGERVLPAGRFDPGRLRAIDADVRLQARRVRGLGGVPLEGFDVTLRLQDAVLQLDPLAAAEGARRGDSAGQEEGAGGSVNLSRALVTRRWTASPDPRTPPARLR